MTLITLKDLKAHLWHAAHIITGPIDASDYKTYIFPILFFKRICDVYDEEYTEALEQIGDAELAKSKMFHRIQIPEQCHWQHVFNQTKDIGQALKEAFRGIELANEHLHGIFGDAGWTNKDRLSDELLGTLLNHFNKVNLGVSSVRDDDMGRAYEYLIKCFADKANKKAGEFYTPRTIVRLMVNILDPKAGESVYDPACGTGGMLLETIHHVKENGGDPRLLKIKGQEKNLTTEAIARMNLFLHGMEDFDIVRGDTLRHPKFIKGDKLETFDCVIANPPFSLSEWGYDLWQNDPYTKGRAQNTLSVAQADQIYHLYQSQEQQGPGKAEEIEGVARWVNLTEIEENDFNLNIARYVQKPLVEETITVEEALLDFKHKLAALEQAEQELEDLLFKEGFEI